MFQLTGLILADFCTEAIGGDLALVLNSAGFTPDRVALGDEQALLGSAARIDQVPLLPIQRPSVLFW